MSKPLHQITFEFSREGKEPPTEFLSGQPIPESSKAKPKSTRGRKSTKATEVQAEPTSVPEDDVLFQKQYYAIGEVAAMFNVNISLLRYWENEFDVLEPRKNRKGDRFFKPSDIKNLELIFDLIRRRKFTVEGAKEYIRKNKQVTEKHMMIQSLQKLKAFLLQLKADL